MASIERETIIVAGGEGAIGRLLVRQLRDAGADVITVNVGVWEPVLTTTLGMSALLDQLGGRPIDILVNLGSLTCCSEAAKETAAQAEAYGAGLIAASLISRALLPSMKALNTGHIVSVGASFDDRPIGDFGIWATQIAGHRGLTKALLSEVTGSCVRVSYVDVFAEVSGDEYAADRIFAAITDFDWRRLKPAASTPLAWTMPPSAIPVGIVPLPTLPLLHAPDAQHLPHYH
jgi:NAD(P)-dependent dehydrogenase (short-subunit alcohol dehydrogenase family)